MPRDAAYDALTVFTREAYEKETHRNNAKATLDVAHPDGRFRYSVRMVKPIRKGDEILCSYGWDFHERTTLGRPRACNLGGELMASRNVQL